jgi:hypothetical protein
LRCVRTQTSQLPSHYKPVRTKATGAHAGVSLLRSCAAEESDGIASSVMHSTDLSSTGSGSSPKLGTPVRQATSGGKGAFILRLVHLHTRCVAVTLMHEPYRGITCIDLFYAFYDSTLRAATQERLLRGGTLLCAFAAANT